MLQPRHWLNARSMWQRRYDIILLACSIACFGGFVVRSMRGPDGGGGSGIIIGKVEEGSLQRKRAGGILFTSIGPDDQVFHMDALWTGPSETAMLHIDPRSKLKLYPNTFLIIRKPLAGADLASSVQLVQGKAEVTEEAPARMGKSRSQTLESGKDEDQKLVQAPKPKSEPSPKPEEPKPAATPVFYPGPNATFILAGSRETITFSWGVKHSGSVVIKDSSGRAVSEVAFRDNSFVRGQLDNNRAYTWSVVDEQKKPLYGPFHFSIKNSLGRSDVRDALQQLRQSKDGSPEKSLILRTH